MILSVSRRTDIPNYYSDWFFNRIRQGEVYIRNPINIHQISRIELSPKNIDCIVFWSKNPKNMINRIGEIDDYKYYFQFTITGYGKDVEANLPSKKEVIIPTFIELSKLIGKDRVIWRYDPIMINQRYSVEYHLKAFREIAQLIHEYTNKVIISFVDLYAKTKRNTKELNITSLVNTDIDILCKGFMKIANEHGLIIESCAEMIDLDKYGIQHGSCIDKKTIERIIGSPIKCGKDKNQRQECGCVESIDIGTYNTCRNGCKYCYANFNQESVNKNSLLFDVNSPILCSEVTDIDKITDRKVKSIIQDQVSFFDNY